LKIALAEAEARAGDPDRAVAILDEALATSDRTGHRAFEAELHRVRGEIRLQRDPGDPAPVEEAFLTAIAVAKQQGTRSFELRAAFSLAKLYQSTGRLVDAQAVLAPALEGFSPTAQMPEIAEAQALLVKLAETDEVKEFTASRHRRLQLQTSYSRAVMYSKGFGSDEAKAAFARARELAEGVGNVDERFITLYGLWLTSLNRGELGLAQETAEVFRGEAESLGRLTDVAVADRFLGIVSHLQGDFARAKAQLEEALRIYDPERDRDTRLRYGIDTAFGATLFLSHTTLMLGDIEEAVRLIEDGVARTVESHVPELINACFWKTNLEWHFGDAKAVLRGAETLAEIARTRQAQPWKTWGWMADWARVQLGDRTTSVAELGRRWIDENSGPSQLGRLAELEAEAGDFEDALARIDRALAIAGKRGERWSDAFLYRLRGEILLKRDPHNAAPAEECFQTALAVAKQQGGRFFGLRAALSLAKLYQSTGRPAEAHAVLAPALEGFVPTPEMPEIAEAQALLAAIAAGAHVRPG
jgi:tetratricopeptide (TPR) repeat protein